MQIEGKKIRLKELRKESKLTQEQLANYLKVDQTLNKKSECYTDRKALQLIWVYGGLSAWQGGCVSSTEFCVSLK